MDNRITIDPQVYHGQACIKGTRLPVHQILRMLANGDTIEDLLQEYPSLTWEDILACFDYAASLAEEQMAPLEVHLRKGMNMLVDEHIPLMTVQALPMMGHDVRDVRGTPDEGMQV